MNILRVASAALICGSLLTLTACAGEDSTTSGSAQPGAAAPTSAAAPAAAGKTDKELCESAKKAGEEMTEDQLKKEEDRIKKERKTKQYWIEGTMTLGIPLLFVAIGVLLWQVREGRRKNAVALLAA